MSDPTQLIWTPKDGPYFERLSPADNPADIRASITLDGETGKWYAFVPLGSPRGIAPNREEAKRIVETFLSEQKGTK